MAKLTFTNSAKDSKRLSRLVEQGALFRIRQGVYIDTDNPIEINSTLKIRWYEVANYLTDQPVAAFRTASELMPADDGRIYLIAKTAQRKTVEVGNLLFDISPGDTELGVINFLKGIKCSNLPRQCLENLMPSRARKTAIKKTLGTLWVETALLKELQTRGESGLNVLRDEAKALSAPLGLTKEFSTLNKMVSAIMNTHETKDVLNTPLGLATAKGKPFDANRIVLFEHLRDYLLKSIEKELLPQSPFQYSKASWRNLSFFESYFSNYIEGTEFTLDEAEEIVFQNTPSHQRHEDSHDVLGVLEICGDYVEMISTPESGAELIETLTSRHRLMLDARPDKRPGLLKEKANKAGASRFVLPSEVEGTLAQGFEIYHALPKGFARAAFIHFLVTECHPFDDGNGRLARLMMNAELVAVDCQKIIVPTVHRESYLNGLKQATQSGRFRAMIKVLHQLHGYCASIDWSDYGEVRHRLELDAADQEPDQGVPTFSKALLAFRRSYLPR